MADVDALFGVRADTSDATREIQSFARTSRDAFRDVQQSARDGGGAVDELTGNITRASERIGGLRITTLSLLGAFAGLATAFGTAARQGVAFDASIETATQQFKTLMGSAADAQAHVKELFDFAARTPFESGEVIKASQALRSAGGASLDTQKNLTLLGDAAAATGAPLTEVSRWVGRLYADLQAGKPFGEAAQRLTELNVITPAARIQLENMMKTAKDGREVWGAFQQQLSRFSGGMEQQAKTWQGVTSTLKDNLNNLAGAAFQPVFEKLRDLIGVANEFLASDSVQQWAKDVAEWLGDKLSQAIEIGSRAFRAIMQTVRDLEPTMESIGKSVVALGQQAFNVARSAAESFVSALSTLKPVADAAWSAIGGLVTTATNAVRAFNELPEPIKIVVGAFAALAAVGPTVIDVIEIASGGLLQFGEKMTAVERATAAWTVVNAALLPGITALNTAVTALGEATGITAVATGLLTGAKQQLAAVILATQINVDVLATRMLGASQIFEVFGTVVNGVKVALSLLGVGVAMLGAAIVGVQIGKWIDDWLELSKWVEYATLRLERFIGLLPGGVTNLDLWNTAQASFDRNTTKGAQALDQQAEALRRLKDQMSGAMEAKSVDDLTAALQALQSEGKASDLALRKIGDRAIELLNSGAKLSPALIDVVTSLGLLTPAVSAAGESWGAFTGNNKAALKALEDWKKAAADATSSMATLSGAQIEGIRWFLQMGAGVEKTAEIMAVFKNQVKQVDEFDKFNDRLREARSGLSSLTDAQIDAIRYWHEQGASVEDIVKIQDVYKSEVEAVIKADKAMIDATKLLAKTNEDLWGSLRNISTFTDPVLEAWKKGVEQSKALDAELRKVNITLLNVSPFEKRRIEVSDWINAEVAKLRTLDPEYDKRFAEIHRIAKGRYEEIARDEKKSFGDQLSHMSSSLQAMGQAFANLATAAGGSIGVIGKAVGGLITAFSAGVTSVKSFSDGLSLLGKEGRTKTDVVEGISGVAAGALGLVGVFATVVQGIQDVFKQPRWAAVMHDVGAKWGTEISQGLAEQIDKSAQDIAGKFSTAARVFHATFSVTTDAAELLHVADVIKEAGGLSTKNLNEWVTRSLGLFDYYKKGLISIADVQKSLDAVFPMFVEQIKQTGGSATKAMVDIVKLDDQLEIHSRAVADFVSAQLAGVSKDFQAFTGYRKKANESYATDTKDLADLQAKLAKATTQSERDELNKQIADRRKALDDEAAAINATAITTQESASGISEALVATFTKLRSEGKSAREILGELGPTILDVAGQLDRLGLSSAAGFGDLVDLAKAAKDPLVSGVLDPLDSITGVMRGLSNTGLMTQTMFTGLADQARKAADTLAATGHGGTEALRLMQPTLQLLWEQQHDFNMQVDDATQKMLNEAEAAGVVGEKHKSAAQQQVDATRQVVTVLGLMAEQFGVVLPKAIADMVHAAQTGSADAAAAITNGPDAALHNTANTANGDVQAAFSNLLTKIQTSMQDGASSIDKTSLAKLKELAAQNGITGSAFDALLATIQSTAQQGGVAINAGIAGGLEVLRGKLGTSASAFDEWAGKASRAVSEVADEVNALNFGHSPGGLKELYPFITGATEAFGAFRTAGVRSAADVKSQIDALAIARTSRLNLQMASNDPAALQMAARAAQQEPTVVSRDMHYDIQINVDAIDSQSIKDRAPEIGYHVLEAIRRNEGNTGTMFTARTRSAGR